MRAAWALQGVGYLVILGALVYLVQRGPEQKVALPQAIPTVISTTSMNASTTMLVRSPAFMHEGVIPSKYTCDGDNISPPIAIDNAPARTATLVLIVDDPDAPGVLSSGGWDHWIVFNIPGTTTRIGEGTDPIGTEGKTSFGETGYGGPCPPNGEHRYLFKVYALDTWLRLPEGSSKTDVLEMMKGHVLESTTLMGRYERVSQ
jgi:hypothetical protein